MNYLIDSNIFIYSGLLEDTVSHPFIIELDHFLYSSITRIEVLGYRHIDAESAAALELIFAGGRQIDLSDAIIVKAIALRQQRKMSLGDAIIAATALVQGLPLATRNVSDFSTIPNLTVLNPYEV